MISNNHLFILLIAIGNHLYILLPNETSTKKKHLLPYYHVTNIMSKNE